MATGPHDDHLILDMERDTAPHFRSLEGAATLPVDEPASADQTRESLVNNIEALEAVFRYMGTAHPEYEKTQARIHRLRALLDKVDASPKGD